MVAIVLAFVRGHLDFLYANGHIQKQADDLAIGEGVPRESHRLIRSATGQGQGQHELIGQMLANGNLRGHISDCQYPDGGHLITGFA